VTQIQLHSKANLGTATKTRLDTGNKSTPLKKKLGSTYHNAGLLNLVHLSDLLGDLGLGHVGLSGVDDVDALRILSQIKTALHINK